MESITQCDDEVRHLDEFDMKDDELDPMSEGVAMNRTCGACDTVDRTTALKDDEDEPNFLSPQVFLESSTRSRNLRRTGLGPLFPARDQELPKKRLLGRCLEEADVFVHSLRKDQIRTIFLPSDDKAGSDLVIRELLDVISTLSNKAVIGDKSEILFHAWTGSFFEKPGLTASFQKLENNMNNARALLSTLLYCCYLLLFAAVLATRGLDFVGVGKIIWTFPTIVDGLAVDFLDYSFENSVDGRSTLFFARLGCFPQFSGTACALARAYNTLWLIVIFIEAALFGGVTYAIMWVRYSSTKWTSSVRKSRSGQYTFVLCAALYFVFPLLAPFLFGSPLPLVATNSTLSSVVEQAQVPICFGMTKFICVKPCVLLPNETVDVNTIRLLRVNGQINLDTFPQVSSQLDLFSHHFFIWMPLFCGGIQGTLFGGTLLLNFLPLSLMYIPTLTVTLYSISPHFQSIFVSIVLFVGGAFIMLVFNLKEKMRRAKWFVTEVATTAELRRYRAIIDELLPPSLIPPSYSSLGTRATADPLRGYIVSAKHEHLHCSLLALELSFDSTLLHRFTTGADSVATLLQSVFKIVDSVTSSYHLFRSMEFGTFSL